MSDKTYDTAGEGECPICKSVDSGYIIKDYSTRHSKEVLIECGKCDSIYILHYKFDKIEVLSNRYYSSEQLKEQMKL